MRLLSLSTPLVFNPFKGFSFHPRSHFLLSISALFYFSVLEENVASFSITSLLILNCVVSSRFFVLEHHNMKLKYASSMLQLHG